MVRLQPKSDVSFYLLLIEHDLLTRSLKENYIFFCDPIFIPLPNQYESSERAILFTSYRKRFANKTSKENSTLFLISPTEFPDAEDDLQRKLCRPTIKIMR